MENKKPGIRPKSKAAPAARRLALEIGIDIDSIVLDDPSGVIQVSDVLNEQKQIQIRAQKAIEDAKKASDENSGFNIASVDTSSLFDYDYVKDEDVFAGMLDAVDQKSREDLDISDIIGMPHDIESVLSPETHAVPESTDISEMPAGTEKELSEPAAENIPPEPEMPLIQPEEPEAVIQPEPEKTALPDPWSTAAAGNGRVQPEIKAEEDFDPQILIPLYDENDAQVITGEILETYEEIPQPVPEPPDAAEELTDINKTDEAEEIPAAADEEVLISGPEEDDVLIFKPEEENILIFEPEEDDVLTSVPEETAVYDEKSEAAETVTEEAAAEEPEDEYEDILPEYTEESEPDEFISEDAFSQILEDFQQMLPSDDDFYEYEAEEPEITASENIEQKIETIELRDDWFSAASDIDIPFREEELFFAEEPQAEEPAAEEETEEKETDVPEITEPPVPEETAAGTEIRLTEEEPVPEYNDKDEMVDMDKYIPQVSAQLTVDDSSILNMLYQLKISPRLGIIKLVLKAAAHALDKINDADIFHVVNAHTNFDIYTVRNVIGTSITNITFDELSSQEAPNSVKVWDLTSNGLDSLSSTGANGTNIFVHHNGNVIKLEIVAREDDLNILQMLSFTSKLKDYLLNPKRYL